jgi:uncharacterized Zn finger protein
MRIIAKCPDCCNNWILDSRSADRRIRCKKCGRLFKVPNLDEIPRAFRVLKRAKSAIYVDQTGKTYG